jgi:ribose 1,5-bisphosphokinase PhnN
VEDLYDMLEIIAVDAHNRRLAQRLSRRDRE